MYFVAWNARLGAPVKTGGTVRSNFEDAASKGNKRAAKMLEGPPRPVALRYLLRWHESLQRGLGRNSFDGGRGDLDWTKFDAWARHFHAKPYAHETAALFDLDLIERDPEVLERTK